MTCVKCMGTEGYSIVPMGAVKQFRLKSDADDILLETSTGVFRLGWEGEKLHGSEANCAFFKNNLPYELECMRQNEIDRREIEKQKRMLENG